MSPNYGKHHTVETRGKMSESHKGEHHSEATKIKMSKSRKKWKSGMYGKRHTEDARRKMSDAHRGEKNHFYDKHHNEESKRKISETHKGKITTEATKIKMRDGHKKFAMEHLGKRQEICRKARAAQRKNCPYWFAGVPFDSNEERQAMIIVREKFNMTPIEGVNCHIRVNGGEIDFRPTESLFIEYHPHDWDGLTHEEYYNQRRKLLDENGFQNCELIVAKSLNEVKKVAPKNKGVRF